MNTKVKLLVLTFFVTLISLNAQNKTETNSNLIGLPGDNLDLYATFDLFQKSKTIEEFETSLNEEKTGINNLDLNLDGKVDFIKIVTKQEGSNFTFILQVDTQKNETQDVAVILVSKDKKEKVSVQMIGDEELYGKNYVIEPKLKTPAVTANPAYSGADAVVIESKPATVVVVEKMPIVRYVYSPVFVPYYSPYYFGYYPRYFRPYPVVSMNLYFGRAHRHHYHYHGGHRNRNRGGNNTIVINNSKTYNNYSRTRNTSNTVIRNKKERNYRSTNVSKRVYKNSTKKVRKKSNSTRKKNQIFNRD